MQLWVGHSERIVGFPLLDYQDCCDNRSEGKQDLWDYRKGPMRKCFQKCKGL